MKTLYFFFFLCVAIFVTLELLLFFEIEMQEWITSYVFDFICMPMVLTICLITAQFLKKDKRTRLPLLPILILTAFYAVFFEALLPNFHPRYTADIWDVPVYFAGSFLFYWIQKI